MDVNFVFLFALDFLLLVMLLDAERADEPRRRRERVAARRRALQDRGGLKPAPAARRAVAVTKDGEARSRKQTGGE